MISVKRLFGPYGGEPGNWCGIARDHGANAWWFHGFNEGCFDSALRSGLEPCVEHATFRADFSQHPELVPIGADGKPIRYGRLIQGICLSNEEFIEEKRAELSDGMKTYSPTGVWLDYLTYAGWFETPDPDLQQSCFCDSCVTAFCNSEGIDASTPSEILGKHLPEWTAHKCKRIAGLGTQFADIVREHDPECLIGIYSCPWTPDEFGGAITEIFAQDLALLARFADVITPLIYCEKSGRSPSWGREYAEASRGFIPDSAVVQPILDALDYPASMLELGQSTVPVSGFQLFAGSRVFEDSASAEVFSDAVTAISRSVF